MSEAARDPVGRGPFNPIVVAAVLLVGFVAFVAFLASTAFDQGLRPDLDGGAHALSKSAVGYVGAVELLKSAGRSALVARRPMAQTGHTSVLILTPDMGNLGSLFTTPPVQRFGGRVLVVLPKWRTGFHPGRLGWVRKAGIRRLPVDDWLRLSPPEPDGDEDQKAPPSSGFDLRRAPAASRHTLTSLVAATPTAPMIATGSIDRFQTLAPPAGWSTMIAAEDGRAVLLRADDQPYFVLTDPDLLNNHGLADIANARALFFILDQAYGREMPYIFDVTLAGHSRSPSFLRQAFEPPFLAATLCAIATVFLMGWHAFFRFGRAREPGREFALGKRALADNQADLIRMTGREHRLGGRYGDIVRDLAARAVGAPRDMSPAELDAFLDRLGQGGRTSWPLTTLRRDIEQAKDAAELARAAGRLHHWRLEMTRERQ